jgi:hypothetical protein
MIFNQWLTSKPDFDQECIVITESKFKEYPALYTLWTINTGNGYIVLLDQYGNEWGDISYLKADRYFIIQTK